MSAAPLSAEAFAAQCGVSRETLDRFHIYLDLLRRWQSAINLVGPATLRDPWRRHFWDSAQILRLIPESAQTLLDIGSGAGFPGMVLAILGARGVALVESDGRKAAFLREIARVTGAAVTIHADRLEHLHGRIAPPDIITARAVASLDLLLDQIKLYMTPNTVCLFHKGRQVDSEIAQAEARWTMRLEKIPSETDPAGVILRVEDIRGG
ncbi:MAG: 16S rRNA (guanine(527)-N(7))-methyltransferase RsmG [Alphaproteobacteria bacterium]|nr:16S rRNA (guanine(527)-N(7))-methyltransferase RsmG [Alphaproteobacteria bacterium]